jgi:hypothetical protein
MWAVLFAGSMGLVSVAALLDPSGAGTGTHLQLGMAPCATLAATGFPCPTCGMTTAFAHAADGNLVASFAAQPAGALLAVLTAMTALVSGYAMMVGLRPAPMMQRLWTPGTLLTLGAVVILGWIYKILSVHGVL